MIPLAASPRRRGALLVESVAAVIVLIAALGVTVRLLGFVASERRSAERRQFAAQAAANAMEQIAALDWDDLTPDRLAQVRLDDTPAALLPGGRLAATVHEPGESDPPGVRRVRVEVRWRGSSGQDVAPVRLSAYLSRRGRGR